MGGNNTADNGLRVPCLWSYVQVGLGRFAQLPTHLYAVLLFCDIICIQLREYVLYASAERTHDCPVRACPATALCTELPRVQRGSRRRSLTRTLSSIQEKDRGVRIAGEAGADVVKKPVFAGL